MESMNTHSHCQIVHLNVFHYQEAVRERDSAICLVSLLSLSLCCQLAKPLDNQTKEKSDFSSVFVNQIVRLEKALRDQSVQRGETETAGEEEEEGQQVGG